MTEKREAANAKLNDLANLIAGIDHFLTTAKDIKPARPVVAKLKPGETFHAALARVRAEISALTQELSAVKAAPLPVADLKSAVRNYVADLATKGAPSISSARGSLRVDWARADTWDSPTSSQRLAATLAWLDPGQMVKRLEASIDARPESATALSAPEKARRLDQLTADLDRLSRQEEAIIEAAASDGITVMRRPNALPQAVLGVVVA